MPVYTFHCESCNQDQEYLLPMGEAPLACSGCGTKGQLEKRVDSFSAHASQRTNSGQPKGYHVPTVGPALVVESFRSHPDGSKTSKRLDIFVSTKDINPARDN